MKKLKLEETAREELIEMVKDLHARLQKKTEDLTQTRQRLQRAKTTIQRLKSIISYQRTQVLSHYGETRED